MHMYSNLRAELARQGFTYKDVAGTIETSEKTVVNKMTGIRDWNRKEMFLIRDKLFPKCTLEYLFTTE